MNYLRGHPPLPFRKGERIEVRGFRAHRTEDANPYPALSLAKGEVKFAGP
jgi:hypothetical protein